MTVKSYWSRSRNLRDHLNNPLDSDARREMYNVTKKRKYTNTAFEKRKTKYGKREVARDMSAFEHKKTKQLKVTFNKLKKQGKVKGSFKQFRKTNRHATQTDFESIEVFYDSP